MNPLSIFTLVILFITRCRFPKNESIADVVRRRYGSPVLKQLRNLEKLDFKIKKILLDISFLETCIRENIIPSFLNFKLPNKSLRNSDTYLHCQNTLLNAELLGKKNRLAELKTEFNSAKNVIHSNVSHLDVYYIVHLFTSSNDKTITKIKEVQNLKLTQLVGQQKGHNAEDVIFNYSSYVLSDTETSLLCKGLNYALPPKKLKYEEYLLPFELLFRSVRNDKDIRREDLIHLRSKLCNTANSSFRAYNKKDHRFENLSKEEYDAFLKLASNEDIVIQKADKGNTVVIVDKNIYIEKMEAILSDTSKFAKVKFGHELNKELRHILDMEDEIRTTLNTLHDSNYLSKEDYDQLWPVGSRPGVLYGLCKVHKKVVGKSPPFRQILSAIGTCTYNIAKFFVPILKPYTFNEYTLKDSFTFAEEIQKQDPSLYMTSFDVESLFTNIPLDETTNICLDILYNKKRKLKGLLKRHCKELLCHATKKSCFIFNNTYYKQVDGMSMGSPLGPTYANIFLCFHEKNWLNNCPAEFKPVYYRRYVDDVIVLFKDKSHVPLFHNYLNQQHPNMKFTCEEEKDKQLSFLDILIKRDNNKFSTSLYRKETFSGVYSNFHSFMSSSYKEGLIFTLLHRIFVITSSYQILHEEICKLKTILLKNAFPLFVIDRCILKFFDKIFTKPKPNKSTSETPKKEVLCCLPFLGKASLDLKKSVKNIFKSCAPSISVKFVFSSKFRISTKFSFKDKIPLDLKSHVLYRFTCAQCNLSYIGETTRHFLVRSCEHLAKSYRTNKNTKPDTTNTTSVTTHCHLNEKHKNELSSIKIIGSENNPYYLKIKESLLIHMHNPIINKDIMSVPLYLFNKLP